MPDPQDPGSFERSRLNWDEPAQEAHRAMLDWHRSLIALRHEMPELTDGRLRGVEVDFDEGAAWLSYRRGRVSIAFNLGGESVRLAGSVDRLRWPPAA